MDPWLRVLLSVNRPFHCLLASITSDAKSAVSLIVVSPTSLAAFKSFSVSLAFNILTMMFLSMNAFLFILLRVCSTAYMCLSVFLHCIWKVFSHDFFEHFSAPLSPLLTLPLHVCCIKWCLPFL